MLLRRDRSNQDGIGYDPDPSSNSSESQQNYLLTTKTLMNHNALMMMVELRRAVFTAKYNTNYNIFLRKEKRRGRNSIVRRQVYP
jgi:hypothetical protein